MGGSRETPGRMDGGREAVGRMGDSGGEAVGGSDGLSCGGKRATGSLLQCGGETTVRNSLRG